MRPATVRLLAWLAAAALAGAQSAGAAERPVRAKLIQTPGAPVRLARPALRLAETYATPTQLGAPDASAQQSQVRYANRAGLSKSGVRLKGEVDCSNPTRVPVEAVSLAVTALDPFGAPLPVQDPPPGTAEQQLVIRILPRETKRLSWEQPVGEDAVFEVSLAVVRVRFADGTVWSAPVDAPKPVTPSGLP